jgi:hypothetical protein
LSRSHCTHASCKLVAISGIQSTGRRVGRSGQPIVSPPSNRAIEAVVVSVDQIQNPAPERTDQAPPIPRPDRIEHYFNKNTEPTNYWLGNIWRGECGLGFSFWIVGAAGTFPVFALIFGALFSEQVIVPLVESVEISVLGDRFLTQTRSFLWKCTFGLAAIFYIFPATAIWRSAMKSSSKMLANLAQIYAVFAVFVPLGLLIGALLFALSQDIPGGLQD